MIKIYPDNLDLDKEALKTLNDVAASLNLQELHLIAKEKTDFDVLDKNQIYIISIDTNSKCTYNKD